MARIRPRGVRGESKTTVENLEILTRSRGTAFEARDTGSQEVPLQSRPGDIADLHSRGVALTHSTGKCRALRRFRIRYNVEL
jgi:hypothetical protein